MGITLLIITVGSCRLSTEQAVTMTVSFPSPIFPVLILVSFQWEILFAVCTFTEVSREQNEIVEVDVTSHKSAIQK
jgi:hypothetical protein